MKLSEAIRLGAMSVEAFNPPQARVFDHGADGMPCRACALGTAAVAVGLISDGWFGDALDGRGRFVEAFPIAAVRVRVPGYTYMERNVAGAASVLFESRHWTREQIADWVESIERAHEAPLPSAGEAPAVDVQVLVSERRD